MAENEPLKSAQAGPQKLAAVNIIRIGSALAAVETTTAEESKGDDQKGLQIGVVGGQASRGSTRGVQGAGGRVQGGTNQMGRGLTGRSSRNQGTLGGRTGNRTLPGGRPPY